MTHRNPDQIETLAMGDPEEVLSYRVVRKARMGEVRSLSDPDKKAILLLILDTSTFGQEEITDKTTYALVPDSALQILRGICQALTSSQENAEFAYESFAKIVTMLEEPHSPDCPGDCRHVDLG